MIVYQDEQVCIFQSTLYQTNTLLYISKDFLLLVDPNWTGREVAYIANYIETHFAGVPIYLLFTHSDYDHIIGYQAFPGAKVIASKGFQDRHDKKRILGEIHEFDQQHYIQRPYPIEYPEVDIIIDQEGMQVAIGGEKFWFYHAPGHTSDGLFTIIESAGIFIAGDYLSNLEFPFIYDSATAYLATLQKVKQILQVHPIRLMVPGHGAYIKDQISEILERAERDRSYIEAIRQSVREDNIFPEEEWLSKFPFPDGLRDQHQKNMDLIRQEL